MGHPMMTGQSLHPAEDGGDFLLCDHQQTVNYAG
jgi:hypothetical protein